jgi:hypothetical protein
MSITCSCSASSESYSVLTLSCKGLQLQSCSTVSRAQLESCYGMQPILTTYPYNTAVLNPPPCPQSSCALSPQAAEAVRALRGAGGPGRPRLLARALRRAPVQLVQQALLALAQLRDRRLPARQLLLARVRDVPAPRAPELSAGPPRARANA